MVWFIVLVAVIVSIGAFLFYASFNIGSGVYVKALCKGDTKERVVSLTFDDGPDARYTPELLDVLNAYQAPAYFFCIGSKAEKNREIMDRLFRDGYYTGNHSYAHSWKFPFYSDKEMEDDWCQAEDVLLHTSQGAVLCFRPPFGVTNPRIARVAKELEYTVIGWSIRSYDTIDKSEDRIFRRIVRQLHPGAVILLHDRMPGCASLVARLLEHLKTIDYKVIPLNEMFDIPNPYDEE